MTKLNKSNITDDQFINELFNALNISLNGDGNQDIDFHATSNVVTSPKTTQKTRETTKTLSTATTKASITPTTKSGQNSGAKTKVTTKLVNPLTTTQTTTTTTTSESVVKKLERAKSRLNSIHKKKDKKAVVQLVDEVLSTSDMRKLNKGRKTEDTKAVLNYMMSALYSIKQKKPDFDTNKFFDEVSKHKKNSKYFIYLTLTFYLKVIAKPQDVLPDGLFETDIVLTKEQAEIIFSEYSNDDGASRTKRKVVRDLASLWPSMPINYIFDGSHRKLSIFFWPEISISFFKFLFESVKAASEKDMIRTAIRRWEEETCITFREYSSAPSGRYLRFIKGGGYDKAETKKIYFDTFSFNF